MKNIKDVNILVVGDIMLDVYISGNVERISPEAPVPVVNIEKQYHTLGGCGNVIKNLTNIGANVTCVAKIGRDDNGTIISEELVKCGAKSQLVVSPLTPTTTKTRIVTSDRGIQLIRLDSENTIEFSQDVVLLLHQLKLLKDDFDIIIVSDYAKGVINELLMNELRSRNTKIVVDPKRVKTNLYDNVFIVTPNEKEFNAMFSDGYNYERMEYIIKTMGPKGMKVIDVKADHTTTIRSKAVDVYNVSGAGDTVVATISAAVAMGFDVVEAAAIANMCAGYVVTKPGTTSVPISTFESAIWKVKHHNIVKGE